jgi:hypothetical protein
VKWCASNFCLALEGIRKSPQKNCKKKNLKQIKTRFDYLGEEKCCPKSLYFPSEDVATSLLERNNPGP